MLGRNHFDQKVANMKKKNKQTKTININYIARVEGEGSLSVEIVGNKIQDVKLKIFEPPRFFEALLQGRDFNEAPDITARICGICPVAYQMSAVHAMEQILDVTVDGQLAELRRLIYCGEWISSHTLHIYMLHAPDFLGFPDVIQMASKHREEVERGLNLKKLGNQLIALVGGREVHPINVKVGGFYKVPEKRELQTIVEELKRARDAAIETVRWVATFDFLDFEKDYEFVSLHHPSYYPLDVGTILSNKGLNMPAEKFHEEIEEFHVAHSTALQSKVKKRGAYFCGPMARYHLNYDNLSPIVKELACDIGFPNSCNNPFKSIIVRALEVLYATDEALRIIGQYEKPDSPCVNSMPKSGEGFACTEAPRGILYHRYTIDEDGQIELANIIPPTSQNQKLIEEDLYQYLQPYIDLDDEKLQAKCEQFIRNYDPCISCATHFLKLKTKRS
jgi:coenzyme F420-reducing hydrogenase alpha subunit